MLLTYYTLDALARAWRPGLVGCRVGDAFSQERGELTLALASERAEWMLRVSTQAPFYFIFRSEGYSRARRNVATLFEDAFGRHVEAVRLADRDRMLFLDLDDGSRFQVVLFGPRANVFLVGPEGTIREAFQEDERWEGEPAPAPRAAPEVETFEAFEARWRTNRKTLEQAVASAFPLFDRTLAAEAVHRAGLPEKPPADATEADRRALFDAAAALRAALADPAPRIYWKGRFAEAFALVPLRHLEALEAEPFEHVDAAVRVYVRRRLAEERFRARYEPLEQ
ncbi:MAG: NFACT family protein, partial [Rhodothermales bacterium]|nr:NFACT family protein [Rhodothermales bacterium]